MEIYEKLWQQILGELQSIYTQETYDDYFSNLNEIYTVSYTHLLHYHILRMALLNNMDMV